MNGHRIGNGAITTVTISHPSDLHQHLAPSITYGNCHDLALAPAVLRTNFRCTWPHPSNGAGLAPPVGVRVPAVSGLCGSRLGRWHDDGACGAARVRFRCMPRRHFRRRAKRGTAAGPGAVQCGNRGGTPLSTAIPDPRMAVTCGRRPLDQQRASRPAAPLPTISYVCNNDNAP